MTMKIDGTFDVGKKGEIDVCYRNVQEWEKLMWKFHQSLSWAKEGEKWVLVN